MQKQPTEVQIFCSAPARKLKLNMMPGSKLIKFCQEAWKRGKRANISDIFLQNTFLIYEGG